MVATRPPGHMLLSFYDAMKANRWVQPGPSPIKIRLTSIDSMLEFYQSDLIM